MPENDDERLRAERERMRKINRQTWDNMAKKGLFQGTAALPCFGPFGATLPMREVMGEIRGKVFLELCGGSGHSTKRLIDDGAIKVYCLDGSAPQLERARNLFPDKLVKNGQVVLLHRDLEADFDVEVTNVDCVFSLYGIGWSFVLQDVLAKAFRSLKPTGRLVVSWEHPTFTKLRYNETSRLMWGGSYHDETPHYIPDYQDCGPLYIIHRKIETWLAAFKKAGFVLEGFYEPMPVDARDGNEEVGRYYSLAKARDVPATMVFVLKKSCGSGHYAPQRSQR